MDIERRSGCPINLSMEVVGDRWSLVVVRDMMFGNRRHFRDLLTRSHEGIASNILASRLKRLTALGPDRVEIALVLHDKPANRMPEAGFLLVTPKGARDWTFEKLGRTGAAGDVVARGGGQLQAVQSIGCALGDGHLAIEPLDSALVGPADRAFMPFHPAAPDFAAGVAINLYNNKWGTNFPMWWEGSILSRLIITLR